MLHPHVTAFLRSAAHCRTESELFATAAICGVDLTYKDRPYCGVWLDGNWSGIELLATGTRTLFWDGIRWAPVQEHPEVFNAAT